MESEKRCRNFSEFERQLLVDVVLQYPEIESKTTDKVSQHAKKLAWETVTKQFVSVSGVKRDASQLKTVSVTFLYHDTIPTTADDGTARL